MAGSCLAITSSGSGWLALRVEPVTIALTAAGSYSSHLRSRHNSASSAIVAD